MYTPATYWGELVTGTTGVELDQVGWEDMGRAFNERAYRLRGRAFDIAVAQWLRERAEQRDRRTDSTPGEVPLVGPDAEQTRVFEAGFGVGYYLENWRRMKASRVVGVDISAAARDNCLQRYPEFDLRTGDVALMTDWPDIDELQGSFDIVTCIDVIYHVVNDEDAARAISGLASLVAPGGVLLMTDKFIAGASSVQEAPHCRRRSLSWYTDIVAPSGLRLHRVIPVFWCMDKPTPNPHRDWRTKIAGVMWTGSRAATKYWPRNSRIQNVCGLVVGTFGLFIDQLAVRQLPNTHNLTLAVFKKA